MNTGFASTSVIARARAASKIEPTLLIEHQLPRAGKTPTARSLLALESAAFVRRRFGSPTLVLVAPARAQIPVSTMI
jgi:hypothetical protein